MTEPTLVDPSVDTDLASELLALELALGRRDLAALPGGVDAVLDGRFVEFGASGRRWDRVAILEMLRDAPPADIVIESFAAAQLTDDVVLATYRLRFGGPDGSRSASLRSSVWVQRDGRWRIRFHQGTATAE